MSQWLAGKNGPRHVAQLTLTLHPRICPVTAIFHADVSLTSGGSGTYTFAYSVLTALG